MNHKIAKMYESMKESKILEKQCHFQNLREILVQKKFFRT